MTKYKKQLVRDIRKLRFPAELPEIEKIRYCHPECLAAFLDLCDELALENPSLAMEVAQAAPDYARRVIEAVGDPTLGMRAHAVVGSACLATGRYGQAEAAFLEAEEFGGDGDEEAALACRLAHLRALERRFPEALEAAELAVGHFEERYDPGRPEQETDRLSLAVALITRANVAIEGYLRAPDPPEESLPAPSRALEGAARDLCRALAVCQPRTGRARLAAIHNFAFLAAAAWIGGEPGFLPPSQVVALMRQMRKELRRASVRHGSVLHAKVRWLMGLALAQESMGLTRRAEKYLWGALEDFVALESYSDAAMISLDLGWWLYQEREWEKLRDLASGLVTAPWARRFPAEWQSALKLWQKSVRKRNLAPEVLVGVYRTVRGIRLHLPAAEESPDRWSTPIGW